MYKTIKSEIIENLNEQLTYRPKNPIDLYWYVCEALLGKYNVVKLTMEYLMKL